MKVAQTLCKNTIVTTLTQFGDNIWLFL